MRQPGEGRCLSSPQASSAEAEVLIALGDRLEGRFLPKWAGFMAMRATDGAPPPTRTSTPELERGRRSTMRLGPQPWAAAIPWFLAQARLPRRITFGYRGRGPEWTTFTGKDGLWCAVRLAPDEEGARKVRQGGPVAIWDQLDDVQAMWERLGRPGWERLGLTVGSDGHHRVWLDEPDGAYHWSLPWLTRSCPLEGRSHAEQDLPAVTGSHPRSPLP